jgi:signal transduction histidine kinase
MRAPGRTMVGATETGHVQTTQVGEVHEPRRSPRDARNDAVIHELEEPLGELVRALQRRQIYRLADDVEPPDRELLGRARSLVRDLQTVLAEMLDRPVAPTDPREWHDTMSMRSAFEDAAASAKDALAGRSLLIDVPATLSITTHAPRLHELLVEVLALAGRLQPAAWTVRVAVERRDGDVTIIVPSTDHSDTLSVGDQRHVQDLARSLGGRIDVIGHPDSHAGLHVRLPQQRADDPRSA